MASGAAIWPARSELWVRALQGVFRSLRVYQGPDAPRAAMDALYRRFMQPGDLVFDVGAHVGDRVSSFRRLGARVVAIEPQSLLVDVLTHIHGRDANVVILPRALGARSGRQAFHSNTDNPTVSTISDASCNVPSTRKDGRGKAGMMTLMSMS